MKFEQWNSLYENISQKKIEEISDQLTKDLAPELGKLYYVPNFISFTRKGEPVQQGTLFTTGDLKSFCLNFTISGDLYSIDFWKTNSKSSVCTLYIKKTPFEKIIELIPIILENPNANIDVKKLLKVKKKEILENLEEESDISLEAPKRVEAIFTSTEKKAMDSLYDYSDPDTIFDDLESYLKLVVIDKEQPSLILTGTPGVGKTHIVTHYLKEHNLIKGKDWVHIKGRSTDAALYIALYKNNGKIILLDDCDSVLNSADGAEILKGALDSYDEREISWLSAKPITDPETGKRIPLTFAYNGIVIFISNLPQKKINDALKSRSFVLEIALTQEDMLKRMRKLMPKIEPDMSMILKEEAMDMIENISKTHEALELNLRTLLKSIKILSSVENIEVAKRLVMQQCSYK